MVEIIINIIVILVLIVVISCMLGQYARTNGKWLLILLCCFAAGGIVFASEHYLDSGRQNGNAADLFLFASAVSRTGRPTHTPSHSRNETHTPLIVEIIINIIVILIIIAVIKIMLVQHARNKELSSGKLRISIPEIPNGISIPDGFIYFEKGLHDILIYTGESACAVQIEHDRSCFHGHWFFNNILYVGLGCTFPHHRKCEIFEFAPEIVTPPQEDYYDKFVSEAIKKGTAKRMCVMEFALKAIWKCDTGEQFRMNQRWFSFNIVDEDENIMAEKKSYLLKWSKLSRGNVAGGTIYAADSELFPKLLGMLIFPF